MTIDWSVSQYERFRDERSRPFLELIARVPPELRPRRVVDLGCGTGDLARVLAERWPEARVLGVDASEAMLAAARELPDRLAFEQGALESWRAREPIELLVSNAALHWVGEQPRVLAHWRSMLSESGVLAFQVPANFEAPSHQTIYALADSPEWKDTLGADRVRRGAVLALSAYVECLHALGLEVDAWETTYFHVLEGEDAVLEWLKGTTLRPVLGALDADARRRFLAELAPRLRSNYPSQSARTIFPFSRRFVVARHARSSSDSA